jgi:hypothetical protein
MTTTSKITTKFTHLPKIDTRKLRAPKETRKAQPCFREMTSFLNCISGESDGPEPSVSSAQGDSEASRSMSSNCKQYEVALAECLRISDEERLRKPGHKSSMTFHLQKFAREMGYKI